VLTCYVGIGSNLNRPPRQVRLAVAALGHVERTEVAAVSSLYGSSPMGPLDQPDYCNAVVRLITALTASQLLIACQAIEVRQGRKRVDRGASTEGQGRSGRADKWGPRNIDLDLLLYAEEQINLPGLVVPHPGLHQRDFVLYPLLELSPGLDIPGLGSAAALADRCKPHALSCLGTIGSASAVY
jgi:2-amino-4-hydroxy-6-hydroxymethyldihydropteridine diphosphokinase